MEITGSSLEEMKTTPLTRVTVVSRNHRPTRYLPRVHLAGLKKWILNCCEDFSFKVLHADRSRLRLLSRHMATPSKPCSGNGGRAETHGGLLPLCCGLMTKRN